MARGKNSMVAAVGGFLLGPALVGIAAGMFAKGNPTRIAMAHAGGLAACYFGAARYPAMRSVLRGAMWGEGVATTLAVVSIAQAQQRALNPAANTVSLAPKPAGQIQALAQDVLDGGWLKKIAA